MRILLRRLAMDKDVSKVEVNINGTTRYLERHTNPKEGRGYEAEDGIGGLQEKTANVSPNSYISHLSVIIDNVSVKAGSVVMGAIVYEGSKVIDNGEFYRYTQKEIETEKEHTRMRNIERLKMA